MASATRGRKPPPLSVNHHSGRLSRQRLYQKSSAQTSLVYGHPLRAQATSDKEQDLRVCRPGRKSIAGLRPKSERPENGFWPTGKIGGVESGPTRGKNHPKMRFRVIWGGFFLFLGHFSTYFPSEADPHFRPLFFSHFGRRREIDFSLAAKQDLIGPDNSGSTSGSPTALSSACATVALCLVHGRLPDNKQDATKIQAGHKQCWTGVSWTLCHSNSTLCTLGAL